MTWRSVQTYIYTCDAVGCDNAHSAADDSFAARDAGWCSGLVDIRWFAGTGIDNDRARDGVVYGCCPEHRDAAVKEKALRLLGLTSLEKI